MVTAPNGVAWKRHEGCTSSASEFLAALDESSRFWDVGHQWNWWQEGRRQEEHDRLWKVLEQWDHAAPPVGGYLSDDDLQVQARLDAKQARREEQRALRAARYDKERAAVRIRLLSEQATAGFMRHVLSAPLDSVQAAKAEELLNASQRQATVLLDQIGDPDAVMDQRGDLPSTRRERHLGDHMTFFRHRLLDEWSSGQRRRFNQLLAVPVPRAADMCSECQAPADWHTYGLSLRLWAETPPAGSTAGKLAAMLPGWWGRCPACTQYQLQHQWGVNALPGFGDEQWRAMLTPLLRVIFSPDKSAPRKPVDKRAALARRLRATEAEAERLRSQLAHLTSTDEGTQATNPESGGAPVKSSSELRAGP